eukprot:jgi/Mesen1/267/ME1146563C09516
MFSVGTPKVDSVSRIDEPAVACEADPESHFRARARLPPGTKAHYCRAAVKEALYPNSNAFTPGVRNLDSATCLSQAAAQAFLEDTRRPAPRRSAPGPFHVLPFLLKTEAGSSRVELLTRISGLPVKLGQRKQQREGEGKGRRRGGGWA